MILINFFNSFKYGLLNFNGKLSLNIFLGVVFFRLLSSLYINIKRSFFKFFIKNKLFFNNNLHIVIYSAFSFLSNLVVFFFFPLFFFFIYSLKFFYYFIYIITEAFLIFILSCLEFFYVDNIFFFSVFKFFKNFWLKIEKLYLKYNSFFRLNPFDILVISLYYFFFVILLDYIITPVILKLILFLIERITDGFIFVINRIVTLLKNCYFFWTISCLNFLERSVKIIFIVFFFDLNSIYLLSFLLNWNLFFLNFLLGSYILK